MANHRCRDSSQCRPPSPALRRIATANRLSLARQDRWIASSLGVRPAPKWSPGAGPGGTARRPDPGGSARACDVAAGRSSAGCRCRRDSAECGAEPRGGRRWRGRALAGAAPCSAQRNSSPSCRQSQQVRLRSTADGWALRTALAESGRWGHATLDHWLPAGPARWTGSASKILDSVLPVCGENRGGRLKHGLPQRAAREHVPGAVITQRRWGVSDERCKWPNTLSSAWRGRMRSCRLRLPGHHGMEEVRGSSPLSSTHITPSAAGITGE